MWDLDTQHCVQTLVGHRTEVTRLAHHAAKRWLVSGAADQTLRVWDLHAEAKTLPLPGGEDTTTEWIGSTPLGTVGRQTREKVATLCFSPDGSLLVCQVCVCVCILVLLGPKLATLFTRFVI